MTESTQSNACARIPLLAFVIAFTGAATPGPMLALVIGQVLAHQTVAAAAYVLVGHALIEVVFVLCLAFGFTRALARKRTRGLLAVVGGLALGWMGVDVLLHVSRMTLSAAGDQALPWYGLVLGGVGVSLSNPYFTGWWATVGSGQIAALGLKSRRDYVLFFCGHEMGDVVWYMFVACVLVVGARWLTDSVYRALLWGCGAVITALACAFLVLGCRYLLSAARDGSAAGPPAGSANAQPE